MTSARASLLPDSLPADAPELCVWCRRPLCDHGHCQVCGPCARCERMAIAAKRITPLALLLLEKECGVRKHTRRAQVLRRFAPEVYAPLKRGPKPRDTAAPQIASAA